MYAQFITTYEHRTYDVLREYVQIPLLVFCSKLA